MRSIQLLMATAVFLSAGVAAGGPNEPIPWVQDVQQARDMARQQDKNVLIHFWSESCGPCRKLDQYVFPNPQVGMSVAAACVPVKVNVADRPELAREFGINRIPTDVFITADGQELWRSVSPDNAGEYIAMVNRVADRSQTRVNSDLQQLAQVSRQTAPTSGASPYDMRVTAYQQSQERSPGEGSYRPQDSYRPEPQPGVARGNTPTAPNNPAYMENPHVRQNDGGGWQDQQSALARGGGSFQPGGAQAESWSQNPYVTPSQPDYAQRDNRQPDYRQPTAPNYSAQSPPNYASQPPPQTSSGFQPAIADPSQASTPNPAYGDPGRGFNSSGPGFDNRPASPPAVPESRPAPAPGNPPLGLDGYCPVTLVEATTWRKGDARWGAVHRGKLYLFAGEDEKARFMADPDGYSPVLSGYDPVRFFESNEIVEGMRKFGVFYRNRETGRAQIVLFADEAALNRFQQRPVAYAEMVQQAMLQNALGTARR